MNAITRNIDAQIRIDFLKLFSDRLAIPGIQLVWKKGINKRVGNISVISASGWLLNLP